jgi:hypothetical protein
MMDKWIAGCIYADVMQYNHIKDALICLFYGSPTLHCVVRLVP